MEVTPLRRYCRGLKAQEGLQLGFAAVDASEIRRGVREFAVALKMNQEPCSAESIEIFKRCGLMQEMVNFSTETEEKVAHYICIH